MLGKHWRAGTAVGLIYGALVGFLVCYLEYPFPNYTLVGNELIIEVSRRILSGAVARALDSPFHLFLVYALGGALAGALAGLAHGLISRAAGRRPDGRSITFLLSTVVLGGIFYGYTLLALLHFRLPGSAARVGFLVLVLLSFLAAGLISFIISRPVPRKEALLIPWIAPALTAILFVILCVSIAGAIAERGRNRADMIMPGQDASKVIILCLDGVGWDLLDPLFEKGELPALARLIENGSTGILRSTLPPIKSPQVWTSVATSRRPEDHRVFDFLSYSEARGRWVTTTNRIRQKATYWDVLTDLDLPVDVLSWYPSWPPDSVSGVMLTDRATYHTIPERVFPDSYEPFLDSLLDNYRPRIGDMRDRFTSYDPLRDQPGEDDRGASDLRKSAVEVLDQTFLRDLVTKDFALRRIDEGQPDVMAIYFRGTDATQHKFRKFYGSEHNPKLTDWLYEIGSDEMSELSRVIDSYTRFVDECIGEILDRMEPMTTVMVVSDHGSGYRYDRQISVQPKPLLLSLGWAAEADGKIILSKSRFHGGRDSERPHVLKLFVNLIGREEEGIVSPADFPRALDEAERILKGLRTGIGTPVFLDIRRDPHAGETSSKGDLLAELNLDALGGVMAIPGSEIPVSLIAKRSPKSGNHRINGIVILSGDNAAKGKRFRGATIYDVVPTLFYLLGLPQSLEWEGKVMLGALSEKYRAANPVTWIDRYEGGVPDAGEDDPASEGADESVLKELRALGYIQ